MEAFSKKNFILTLSAILVVGLAIMAISLTQNKKKSDTEAFKSEINEIKNQSDSTEVNDIEKDINNTDFSDIDNDLQNIETELNNLE